jgi:hypothetical protein
MTHPGAVPAATVEQAAGVAQRCRPECRSASRVRDSFSHQKQSRHFRRTDRLARIRVRPAFAPHNSLLRVEYTRQRWPIDEGIRDLHQSQTQTHTPCVSGPWCMLGWRIAWCTARQAPAAAQAAPSFALQPRYRCRPAGNFFFALVRATWGRGAGATADEQQRRIRADASHSCRFAASEIDRSKKGHSPLNGISHRMIPPSILRGQAHALILRCR